MPPEASAPRRARRSRLLVFLSVLGPGLIAAAAGNEAGGVITYSSIGAQFGYSMLWLLLLSTFSLIVAQEMGTRMGVVTGKGLADLIREEFGVRVAVFAMVVLFIANLATTVSEFAGITAAIELFPLGRGGLRYALIPGIAALLWLMVTRGSYRKVERVFLAMCSVFFAYVVAAALSRPNWGEVARQAVHPQLPSSPGYVTMAIQLIGTTIAPWMQFYVQSSVRDKGTRADNYAEARLDVFLGSTLSNIISLFIIVACAAALYYNPLHGPTTIEVPSQAAVALSPLGNWGLILFGIGLFNASAVGAVVVPLSTAYAVTEAIGSESGLGRKIREAPLFIGIFTALLVIAVPVVLLTDEKDLFALIKKAQLINGILLPVILVLMLKLINNRRIMGKYVNGPGFNLVAWLTVGLVVCLSIASLFAQ